MKYNKFPVDSYTMFSTIKLFKGYTDKALTVLADPSNIA